jgi:hypothetical protein
MPRCPGLGTKPPDKALLLGVRQHFALPLTGELPAEVGVREHDPLLSARTWGVCTVTNDPPGGATRSSVNPAMLRALSGP